MRWSKRFALLAFCLTAMAPLLAQEDDRPYKVVIQVSDEQSAKWTLALNNARNVQQDLGADKTRIEIVAYGPGIAMLKADSLAANRIVEAFASGVAIVACENTMRNQKLSRQDMLSGIAYASAGVVRIMQRQQQGYAYIRP